MAAVRQVERAASMQSLQPCDVNLHEDGSRRLMRGWSRSSSNCMTPHSRRSRSGPSRAGVTCTSCGTRPGTHLTCTLVMWCGLYQIGPARSRASPRSSTGAGTRRCARFPAEAGESERLEMLQSLHPRRGFHENCNGRLYAVDIEPDGDYEAVCDQLSAWEQAGRLKYEAGTMREQPDAEPTVEPTVAPDRGRT